MRGSDLHVRRLKLVLPAAALVLSVSPAASAVALPPPGFDPPPDSVAQVTPPPPPARDPGATDPPPGADPAPASRTDPAPSQTASGTAPASPGSAQLPPMAALDGRRFTVSRRSSVRLRFVCNGPFSARLAITGAGARRRSAGCRQGHAVMSLVFGARLRRALKAHRTVPARLTIRRDGQPIAPVRMRIGRRHATRAPTRAAAPPRARTSEVLLWNSGQAQMQCSDLYNPTNTRMLLTWRSTDGATRWAYWQVWMEEYWEDPHGVVVGHWWKTLNRQNTSAYNEVAPLWPDPSRGPDVINGYGIASLQQVSYGFDGNATVHQDPWIWNTFIPLGYSVYVRGWARLWLWSGAEWLSQTRPIQPSSRVSGAESYCWNA